MVPLGRVEGLAYLERGDDGLREHLGLLKLGDIALGDFARWHQQRRQIDRLRGPRPGTRRRTPVPSTDRRRTRLSQRSIFRRCRQSRRHQDRSRHERSMGCIELGGRAIWSGATGPLNAQIRHNAAILRPAGGVGTVADARNWDWFSERCWSVPSRLHLATDRFLADS